MIKLDAQMMVQSWLLCISCLYFVLGCTVLSYGVDLLFAVFFPLVVEIK